MDNQAVALVGIVLTFIVGILNLYVSVRVGIQGKYSDIINQTMNDWIRDLRLETGEFISVAIKLFYKKNKDAELFSELVKRGYIIRTHVGKQYVDYQDIVNTIISIDYDNNTLEEEEFISYLEELERSSIECFIDRWKNNQKSIKRYR